MSMCARLYGRRSAKDQQAPWWTENSKEAYSSGLANLATALRNWSASRSGKRAGQKVAFSPFTGRRARLTCRFTTDAFGLTDDRWHVAFSVELPGPAPAPDPALRVANSRRDGRHKTLLTSVGIGSWSYGQMGLFDGVPATSRKEPDRRYSDDVEIVGTAGAA